MHMDPAMPVVVGFVLTILILGLALRGLRQPAAAAYLIAGVVIGPQGLGLVSDANVITRLGEVGVVLLLFFVGMEISLPRLLERWQTPLFGMLLKVIVGIGCAWLIGNRLDWPTARIVLLGFVLSLNSTAVVLKMLRDWGETDTQVGRDVTGVLLIQDLALIPMLIMLDLLGGETPTASEVGLQVLGGVLLIALLTWVTRRGEFHLPFARLLRADHELQVFAALIVCFGLAFIIGLMGLSVAIGAFVAGILIAATPEEHWVTKSMEPFYVVFVALFFVSIGMSIDLTFARDNWQVILLLVGAVFLINTPISTLIMRMLGDDWRESLYAGALLSQIGEFSLVLAAVGLQAQLITGFAYQTTVAVIALTLLISPTWVAAVKRLRRPLAGAARLPVEP